MTAVAEHETFAANRLDFRSGAAKRSIREQALTSYFNLGFSLIALNI